MLKFFIGPAGKQIAFAVAGLQAKDFLQLRQCRHLHRIVLRVLRQLIQAVDDVVAGDGDFPPQDFAAFLYHGFYLLLQGGFHQGTVEDGAGVLFGILHPGSSGSFHLIPLVVGDAGQLQDGQLISSSGHRWNRGSGETSAHPGVPALRSLQSLPRRESGGALRPCLSRTIVAAHLSAAFERSGMNFSH
jgi:hypothetical protein